MSSTSSQGIASLASGPGLGSIVSWSAPCPDIDHRHLLRLHGYRDESKIRPVIRRTADGIAKRAVGLVATLGCWRRARIEALAKGELKLAGGTVLCCPGFDRRLEGASEIVVFVLTLGQGFDDAVIGLMDKSEPLEALFLETAGRLAIEKLTRLLAADVGRAVRQGGLELGARLGPGYTYRVDEASAGPRAMWPLEQQHELFTLFGKAHLPVELMESAVMRPKMSRSGLFGVMARR